MRFLVILFRLPFRLVYNGFSLLRWVIAAGLYTLMESLHRSDLYVRLTLEDQLPLGRSRKGLARYFDPGPTFLQLRQDLKRVAQSKAVTGVIIETKGFRIGRAHTRDLVALLDDLRAEGKRVVAAFDMATTSEYLLMSSADDLIITPAGRLYTFGARIEQLLFAPLLKRIGVQGQFVHIGSYKTAYNRFIRDDVSPADAAMTGHLRERLDALTRRRIADARNIDDERVVDLFRDAPLDARRAASLGFVDAEAFSHDVERFLGAETNGDHVHLPDEVGAVPRTVSLKTWIGGEPGPLEWRPLFARKKRIAVLDLTGMIIMPRMSVPGARNTIDPDDILPALESIATSYDGLLLHINSPGGSALASDMIWHGIENVRARIPVVAYCSDVAASGGYYLAVGADQIVCHDESIVGSIGVITGKIAAEGVLEHLGVEQRVYEDPDAPATMMSVTEPLSEDALLSVRDDAREFYRRFLHRVGSARGLGKRRLHRYARGRVYLGAEGLSRGLVDGTGGFEEARRRIFELCKADPDLTELSYVATGQKSLSEALRSQIVPSLQRDAEALLGEGVLRYARQPLVITSMLRHEQTLALMTVDTEI